MMPSERHPMLAATRAWLVRVLQVLVFAVFVSFTLTMLIAVFNRFVLNASLMEAEEFVRFCLVWMTLLAAPLVTAEGSHLNGSLMSFIRSPVARWVETLSIKLGVLAFATCLAIAAWSLIEQTISRTPALGINLSFVYAALFVGAVLDVVIVLLDAVLRTQPAENVEYME